MSITLLGTPTDLEKDQLKAQKKFYRDEIVKMQYQLKDKKIPFIVLIEGWENSGRGRLLNDLICEIDPRFLSVFCYKNYRDDTKHPFIYPFYNAIPEQGRMLFMEGGWMQRAVDGYVMGNSDAKEYEDNIDSMNRFERQLKNNGYVVVKFFIHITSKALSKRIKKTSADENNSWRIAEDDFLQQEKYDQYRESFLEVMAKNDYNPWYILNGEDEYGLKYQAFKLIYETLKKALDEGLYDGAPYEEEFKMSDPIPQLSDADYSVVLDDEEYSKKIKKLQKKVDDLHNIIYKKKIPVMVCFEGWDAAGKGGAIKRLAKPLDPRGFDTFPIASPTPPEKNRHFLWRFWNKVPKEGHVSIFDRTWYGRVMVERIEGFCSENSWNRAYNEINEFEKELSDWGAVILKFWIQIDSDTQLARFTDRQNTPEKSWKITDEDWRNREKWPQYEEAVNEMLAKTSTEFAPWHIVESVDKKFARVKVLETFIEALEKAINER